MAGQTGGPLTKREYAYFSWVVSNGRPSCPRPCLPPHKGLLSLTGRLFFPEGGVAWLPPG